MLQQNIVSPSFALHVQFKQAYSAISIVPVDCCRALHVSRSLRLHSYRVATRMPELADDSHSFHELAKNV